MQENVQQSRAMILLKKVWPYFNRVLNAIVYFLLNLIKNFFKSAIQMIKGT